MTFSTEIRLVNDLGDVRRVVDEIRALGPAHGLSARVTFALALALDELLSNTVTHGFDDGRSHEIAVRIEIADGAVGCEIRDDAAAFDPLRAAVPDRSLGIDERPIGGLGILLVRELMDEVRYARRDGLNIVYLRKNAPAAGGHARREES